MTNRPADQYYEEPGWTHGAETDWMPRPQWRSQEAAHEFSTMQYAAPQISTSQVYGAPARLHRSTSSADNGTSHLTTVRYVSDGQATQHIQRPPPTDQWLPAKDGDEANQTSSADVQFRTQQSDPRESRLQPEQSTLSDDEREDEPHGALVTVAELRAHNRRLKRFRLTHSQTRYLMSEFARQPRPDAAHRERLSREIPGFSPRQVQVWFQNRRAKLKRFTNDDRELMTRARVLPANFDMTPVLNPTYSRATFPTPALSTAHLSKPADTASASSALPQSTSMRDQPGQAHAAAGPRLMRTSDEASQIPMHSDMAYSQPFSSTRYHSHGPSSSQPGLERPLVHPHRISLQVSQADSSDAAATASDAWMYAAFHNDQQHFANSAADAFILNTPISPANRRDSRIVMPTRPDDYAASNFGGGYERAFQMSAGLEHQRYSYIYPTETSERRHDDRSREQVSPSSYPSYNSAMGRFGPFVPP